MSRLSYRGARVLVDAVSIVLFVVLSAASVRAAEWWLLACNPRQYADACQSAKKMPFNPDTDTFWEFPNGTGEGIRIVVLPESDWRFQGCLDQHCLVRVKDGPEACRAWPEEAWRDARSVTNGKLSYQEALKQGPVLKNGKYPYYVQLDCGKRVRQESFHRKGKIS
jgi:hypothetical protein